MSSVLIWIVFVIGAAMLGFVGYHFTVRTLRFVTAAFVMTVVALVTRYGVIRPSGGPADLVSSVTRGADKLGAAFARPLLSGHQIPAPGRIGWLVIIAVLVIAYRELEVWAMHWQPPTVDMSTLGSGQPHAGKGGPPGRPGKVMTDRQRHDRLIAELRFRLPAMEVQAPAILPGGSRPTTLASIAEKSGVTGSGLAGAIIRLVGMVWPGPRRYQIRVWVEPTERPAHGEEAADPGMRVTVELEDSRTGGNVATKTLVAFDPEETASVVAGYVARHIFKRDPTAPPWCFGSFDGDDLAAMLFAGHQRFYPGIPHDIHLGRLAQIHILERCRLDAGVARYELAQLHDLEGNRLKALRLHAMNREEYPRFHRGRYRLGMSLEMIANPEFMLRHEHEVKALEESLRILDRCRMTDDASRHDIEVGELPDELRKELLTAAQSELRAVRRQLTLWQVIWAAFRHRDERAIWKPYLRLRERQSFHDGALVAELLAAVRHSLSEKGYTLARKDRHHMKRALHITAAITGDSAAIKALLAQEPWQSLRPRQQPVENAGRTRWLPWKRHTRSWQAAYNTACIYAAMTQSCKSDTDDHDEMARRAVMSLRRVAYDRDCQMERPWDWISHDPDFSSLRKSSEKFNEFLDAQELRDYPMSDAVPAASRHQSELVPIPLPGRVAGSA
jgi:hypothetical protein